MTDQDNLRNFDELRNRIAYILESHAHMAMDQQACAIIDELGLTVETHAATHAKRTMTRITSNWEWDNHAPTDAFLVQPAPTQHTTTERP